jgi:D-alanyl-D-alanine-carboxypeptidase/D-alanyl-D-alanine-endopeptidase
MGRPVAGLSLALRAGIRSTRAGYHGETRRHLIRRGKHSRKMKQRLTVSMKGDKPMDAIQQNCLTAILTFLLLPVVGLGTAPDRAAIDELVKPFLKDKPYLALVVGITRPEGHQVFGYGEVALEGKKQVPDKATIFEIGSITKIFTGTLLADRVLSGVVRLDDPVQKYLADDLTVPRRDERAITWLHLATHTSSLPRVPPFFVLSALLKGETYNPYDKYDQAALQRTLASLTLNRPIGSRFEYSNLGIGLLGLALAQAAKAKSYEDLLMQRMVRPLGLTDTRMQLSAEQSKRFAPGHDKDGKPTSPWTFACLQACGGLRSTARDLLLFADAAMGRKKTPLADAFRMAQQPWRETCRKGESVGLCWFRQEQAISKSDMLWHNGATGGYRSFLALAPEKGVGIVLLSNSPHALDALGVAILKKMAEEENGPGSRR